MSIVGEVEKETRKTAQKKTSWGERKEVEANSEQLWRIAIRAGDWAEKREREKQIKREVGRDGVEPAN